MENITVNGKPLKEHLSEEKSREIQEFLMYEIRSLSRGTRHHIITARPAQNVSRPKYQADGRVEVR